jgi:hypothetical protein
MRVRNKGKGRTTRVRALLDRLQIAAWGPKAEKPPPLTGFEVVRDSFVRCQTTIPTYARCRQYTSITDDTKVYWQYARQNMWLKPWKITLVADDKKGLSREVIELILRHCKFFRFLTVEIALDFAPCTGVKGSFVRRHASFGKSRRRRN